MNREIKWLGEAQGTLGQTRYQEYNPRTGAAIGAPMSEAEFHSRGGLRRFPIVRVVVIPTIPNYALSACDSLKKALNASCLMVNELVDTYNKLIQTGVTQETHTLMKNLIKNAYANWQQLFSLIDGSGCGKGEMFCSVVHPPASWLV